MRRFAAAAVLCAAPLLADAASDGDRIVFEVRDFKSDAGTLRCGLYDSADTFPGKNGGARMNATSRIAGRVARCTFRGVAAGRYAIAGYHDENDNDKLDTNFVGIPKEGVTASREARGHFGPPKFADAAFDYASGELQLRSRVFY